MPSDADNLRNFVATYLGCTPEDRKARLPNLAREVIKRLAAPVSVPPGRVASWFAMSHLRELAECWEHVVTTDWQQLEAVRNGQLATIAPYLLDRSDDGPIHAFRHALRDEASYLDVVDTLLPIAHPVGEIDIASVRSAGLALARILGVELAEDALEAARHAVERDLGRVEVTARTGVVLRAIASAVLPSGTNQVPARLRALADAVYCEGAAWVLVYTETEPMRLRLRVRLQSSERMEVVTPHVVDDPQLDGHILSTFRSVVRLCGPLTDARHVAIRWSVEPSFEFQDGSSLTLGIALALASLRLGAVPDDISASGIVRMNSAAVETAGYLETKALAAPPGRILFGGSAAHARGIISVPTLDAAFSQAFGRSWSELREKHAHADRAAIRTCLGSRGGGATPTGLPYVERVEPQREIDAFLALGASDRPVCLLVGEAGAGKSALLRHLLERHLHSNLPNRGEFEPIVLFYGSCWDSHGSPDVQKVRKDLVRLFDLDPSLDGRKALAQVDAEAACRRRYVLLLVDDVDRSPDLLEGLLAIATECQEMGLTRLRFIVASKLPGPASEHPRVAGPLARLQDQSFLYRTSSGNSFVRLHGFSEKEMEAACEAIKGGIGRDWPAAALDLGSTTTMDLLRRPYCFHRATEALARHCIKEGASASASLGEMSATVRGDIIQEVFDHPGVPDEVAAAIRSPGDSPSLVSVRYPGPEAQLITFAANLLSADLTGAGLRPSDQAGAILREVRRRLPAPTWYRQALRQALRDMYEDHPQVLADAAWILFRQRIDAEASFGYEMIVWLWDLFRNREPLERLLGSRVSDGRRPALDSLRSKSSSRLMTRVLWLIGELDPPAFSLLEGGVRDSLRARHPGAGVFLQRSVRLLSQLSDSSSRLTGLVTCLSDEIRRVRSPFGLFILLKSTFVLLSELSAYGTPADFDSAIRELQQAWAARLRGLGSVMRSEFGRRVVYRPIVWGIRSLMKQLPPNNYINWEDFAAVLRLSEEDRAVALGLVERLGGGPLDGDLKRLSRAAAEINSPFVMSLNEMTLASAAISGDPFAVLDHLEELFDACWIHWESNPWHAATLQSVIFSYCKILEWIPVTSVSAMEVQPRLDVLTSLLRREVMARSAPRGRYRTGKGVIQSPGLNRYLIVREQLGLIIDSGTTDLVTELIHCAFEPKLDDDLVKLLISELQVTVTEQRRWHVVARHLDDLATRLGHPVDSPGRFKEIRLAFSESLAHMRNHAPEQVDRFLASLSSRQGWHPQPSGGRTAVVEEEALSIALEGMVYRLLRQSADLRALVQDIYRAAFKGDQSPATFLLNALEILAGHVTSGKAGT